MHDTPHIVLRRIRLAWSSRRSCGLVAAAMGIRVERVIALQAEGRLSPEDALKHALEAEALAICLPPLPGADTRRLVSL
ncbi:hypothetical protein SAMN05216360_104143 [Methylobacterium phyllostachyos]|uniref:Uncharacterized protein n=1 Tax=Methylobacterium phyllostachyos TaxID=582672 RepID=A0A1G9WVH6_9HYPH|nr:hypothetical protein [Methylobacterium phyllostachyos]SDM88498.1 hypothetical protein SAMN05216360_104143 [Methylobacterium phyllostachyos]